MARWVRCQRTLLVLDGLEPLQHPPGAMTGRLKDPAVQALVKELTAENPGLCVITTRLAVDDIAGRAGTLSVDLEQLPPKAGADLLRQLEVQGPDAELKKTSEGLMPLYAAVVHGCRAGRAQEACEEVYRQRILRGDEHFTLKKLGAFGAELTALAAFFDRPWDQPSAQLTAADQAWILNEAGFVLHALGRLPEAVQPMRAGLKGLIDEENWKQAAASAGNLSELNLTLGEVASAVQDGEESVELAARSEDAFQRMLNRTTLADALHQAGRWEESAALFREAEAMQAEMQPEYPRLYSLRGYRHCDLLLGQAEPDDGFLLVGQAAPASGVGQAAPAARLAAPTAPVGRHSLPYEDKLRLSYRKACTDVRDRAIQALDWMENVFTNLGILSIALGYLSLGRAHLGLADFTEAAKHLDRAVDGLRQGGQDQELPRGLLARAALRRLRDDADAAASDLREAEDIAVRGHMRLHEADVHLEWTRLRLQTGDHEDARRHLEKARELVTAIGYGRREREIVVLEGRLSRL